MTTFSTIEVLAEPGGVVTVWLNRAEKNNAFDARMLAELNTAFSTLRADPSVRLLVLRGRGKHFCAGADVAWMQASAGLDYAGNLFDAQQLSDLMESLYRLPFTTLAVVQGAAFGGAVGLVSCCDLAIGSDEALFSLSEVRIGLVPAVISPYVVKAIGERATRRFALTAARFGGQLACRLGLLMESYPPQELDNAVVDWVQLLSLNGPQAMRATKALLQEVGSGELSAELRRSTQETIAHVRITAEGQEGLQAFLQKRPPAWQEPSL